MESDPPPSYDSVVKKLNDLIGPNPTPQKVLDAAATLDPCEVDIIAVNHDKQPPMTDDQKVAFAHGVATTASTPEAVKHFKAAANKVTAAYDAIDTMFLNLQVELASFDKEYDPKDLFAPQLVTHHKGFRTTVQSSKALATGIAFYSDEFDRLIIPVVTDKTLSVKEKQEKLQIFKGNIKKLGDDAAAMQNSFNTQLSNFTTFAGTFSEWANDKEGADTDRLNEANKALDGLTDKLKNLEISFYTFSGVAVASLPIATVAAAMSGPAAPFVIIGGAIAAGVSAIIAVGLAFGIQKCKKDIDDENDVINKISAEIKQLKLDRTLLTKLAHTDVTTFGDHLKVFSDCWQCTSNDTVDIENWLQEGADYANMPKYLKLAVDGAINAYSAMAVYLNEYANGIIIKE